jgi:TRAP-type C4-dicarboxylate transport system substrate-binding protein
MKKLALILLMIAVGMSAFAQDKIVQLKLGHYSAETHAMHLASVMLAENVAARSNGTIKIEIFPTASWEAHRRWWNRPSSAP